MSIIEQFHRNEEHRWRNVGLRLLLVLATTVLIVWFMPRNEAQQFQYEIGEPWHYGTIIGIMARSSQNTISLSIRPMRPCSKSETPC